MWACAHHPDCLSFSTMPGLSPQSQIPAFLFASLLLACGLQAQAPAPAEGESEVARLRSAFEMAVASTLEPLNRKYVAALRRKEKELAIAKDYETAIALRDERLAVEEMLAKTGAAPTASGDSTVATTGAGGDATASPADIRFSAADAKILNGAERSGQGLRFTAAGQAAEWAVASLPAGGYEVVVTYSCAADSAFQVKEHFFRLSCDASSSGGVETSKTEEFGTLKVTSRVSSITITVDSVSPDAPLLIHELKLISNRG
jgi:hypothetical protein